MGRNKIDLAKYRILSERYDVDEIEVGKIVASFFSAILRDAYSLPFDNPKKILSKGKFLEFSKVRQIPFLGRIGPAYSKYLKWRANESTNIDMVPRSLYRKRISQSEIERTAEAVLSGQAPPPLRKKRNKELFERVWLVGQDGKKSARQVIPKKEK